MAQAPLIPFDYLERQKRRIDAQREIDDPVAKAIGVMQVEQARSTIIRAPDPDTTAKVTRAARETGEPPALIEDRLGDIEKAQRAEKMGALLDLFPVYRLWAQEDPRGVVAASDDHKALGIIGRAWETVKKLPATGKAAWYSFSETNAKLNAVAADYLGGLGDFLDTIAAPNTLTVGQMQERQASRKAYWNAGVSAAATAAKQARPAYSGWLEQNVLQGIEQTPSSLVAGLAGALTRSPGMALTLMGGQTGGSAVYDAREKGLDRVRSFNYGLVQGGIEALTEKIPASSLVEAVAKKTPFGKALIRQLGEEIPNEQVATVLQDLSEWATLNPDKPFSQYVAERPEAAASTLVQTIVGTSVQTAATKAAASTIEAGAKVAGRVMQAQQAKQTEPFFDQVERAAQESKLRQRDPQAYADLITRTANDAGVSQVFVPAEAIRAYQQSDSYDQFDDPFADYQAQIDEADAVGGDVVLPAGFALGTLPGTTAWAAVKADLRLAPGGMSAREAEALQSELDDVMAELSDQAAQRDRAQQGERTAREQIVQRVTAMLQNAGFTPANAAMQAELIAQREATRAARMGRELTGNEFTTQVSQVLPEKLGEIVKADQLDLVVNALRKGGPAVRQRGKSLLEWISARGGIEDYGGDIASMGGDKWHLMSKPVTGKNKNGKAFTAKAIPGRRKLLKDFVKGQGSIIGGEFNPNTIENTFDAAISEGYFPDLLALRETGDTYADKVDTGALLAAISDELAGRPLYAQEPVTDNVRAAADELAAMLAQRGLDASAMSDEEIRVAVSQMGAEQDGGAAFDQKMATGPRGRFIIKGANVFRIELFQARNLSTLLHELSHQWLEELRQDAESPDAPDQVKADWQAAQDWFAKNGHPVVDGVIPVEAHEMWARGGERYLMEGKAPSSALQRLFETFRGWLLSIYKTVEALRAPITPEIREVFDRLLATDEEIAAMAEQQALMPMFKDAAAIGMTGEEFNAYTAQAQAARDEANSTLLQKTMAAIRRRETKRFNDERNAVKADEAERLDNEPLLKSIRLMQATPIDLEWLVDRMGQDVIDLLPRRVPPLWRERGVNPDSLAELAGFGSGQQMIEVLIGAERQHRQAREGGDQRTMRARMIDNAADAEMTRRYGDDPLNDGSIEQEAIAAVNGELQGELLATEVRLLARRTGARPTPYKIARQWARNRVRSGQVNIEASPGAIARHARNVAKAGRDAEKAMLAGKMEEALRFKQQQMLSSALLAEAKAAHDEVQDAVKRMGKIAKRATMKSVDQDYLEQAHALLEAVDLKPRTQKSIDRKLKFEEWAAAQAALGNEVYVPEGFRYEGTNWTRLPVEQLLGMDDAIKSIMHLGRLKQTLLDNQERREFEEWRDEARARLEEAPGRKVTSELGDPSRPLAGIFSNLMKMEVFAAEMDNDVSNGPWQRLMVQRAAEAANYRDEQRNRVLIPIAELYRSLPRKTRDRYADKFVFEEIPYRSPDLNDPRNGQPISGTRWDIIGMALNMGTESNFDKLARGYGVSPSVIEGIVMRELTQEDWQFVSAVWASLETLWPDIAKAERELQGVEPERVEVREVETPFGKLSGGYYPVVYDPAFDQRTEDNLKDAENDLFGKRSGVATSKGHTVTRTDYAAPMLLSPERVIFQHVEKVITRNAYGSWVRDVLKAVKDPSLRSLIDRKFGPEFRQQIEPWLQAQVREGLGNERATRWAEKFARTARVNVTIVSMGLRWSTGVAQTIGLANSAGRIGVGGLRRGMARMLSNPKAAWAFISERSPEMVSRNEAMNRDVSEAFREMRRIRTKNGLLDKAAAVKAKANAYAFWHIGMIDRWMVAAPTWLGAYENAIRDGMDDVSASAYADKMVRLSQGSGREKDLSAWQSNQSSDFLKFFSMFYTPFNVLLNAQWEAGRALRRNDYRKTAMLAFWFMIATPLLDALLAGDAPGDDDEEGWAQWLARNIGFYLFAGIPIVRDAAAYAERKVSGQYATFNVGPISRIASSTEDLVKDIAGDEASDRWVRHAIETPGYFVGLPTGQAGQTAQFIWDVSEGNANPETPGDWYEGLTKGKIKED